MSQMEEDIERILRGEAEEAAAEVEGAIPSYYGAEHPHDAWLRMAERMIPKRPGDAEFYRAGIARWAGVVRDE